MRNWSRWLPLAILCALALGFWNGGGEPWQSFTWKHPLGTDELGRDMLGVAALAAIKSLIDGLVLTAIVLVLACMGSFLAVLLRSRIVATAVVIAGQVVESLPMLLWLFVIVVAIPEPAWFVQAIAFIFASVPMTTRVMIGEFERLLRLPFIEASQIGGVNRYRLMIRHLLPNSWPVLFPLTVQLCGLAVAINGAIGVVGFGNRSGIDLGILLLRGKEYAVTEPHLLLVGVGAFVVTYGILWLVLGGRLAFQSPRSDVV